MRTQWEFRSAILRFLIFGGLPMMSMTVVGAAFGRDVMPWVPDFATAQRDAAASNRLILIHFSGENCPPCERVAATIFSDAIFTRHLAEQYVPVKVNATASPDIARHFRVESWPTDILVSPDGRELFRMTSPQDGKLYLTTLGQIAWRYHQSFGEGESNSFAPMNITNPNRDAPNSMGPGPGPMSAAIAHANQVIADQASADQVSNNRSHANVGFMQPPSNSSMAAFPNQGPTHPATQSAYALAAEANNQVGGVTSARHDNTNQSAALSNSTLAGRAPAGNGSIFPFSESTADPSQSNRSGMGDTNLRPSDPPIISSMIVNQFVNPETTQPQVPQPSTEFNTLAGRDTFSRPPSVQVDPRARPFNTISSPSPSAQASESQVASTSPPTARPPGLINGLSMNAAGASPTVTSHTMEPLSTAGSAASSHGSPLGPIGVVPALGTISPERAASGGLSHVATSDFAGASDEVGRNRLVNASIPSTPSRSTAIAAGSAGIAGRSESRQDGLALNGFCCVTLMSENRWVPGDSRWGARHRGQVFLFQTAAAQQQFLSDPDKYSPVLAGFDPVVYGETGLLRTGSRAHGIRYQDQMYLFTSEDSLQQFWSTPWKYADVARRAMSTASVK